jgi:tetratricopeptide (TPR) repeat protein
LLTESDKDQIRKEIVFGFDKQSVRYYEGSFTSLKSGSLKQRQRAFNVLYDEQSFLSKRVLVPGLFRFVAKKVLSDLVLKRQRPVLIQACLTSLIRPKGVLTDELAGTGNSRKGSSHDDDDSEKTAYTRRHIQRIFHEHFPETFFKADPKSADGNEDERLAPYSSVFSSSELPRTSTTSLAQNYMAFDAKKAMSDSDAMRRIRLDADLKYVYPEYLEDLRQFKDSCSKALRRIDGDEERTEFLISEFSSLTPSFLVFHAHFNSILSLEWFRTRRSQVRERILKGIYPLKYSAADGARARELLVDLTQSDEFAKFSLESCAMAFLDYGLSHFTLLLYKECLKLHLPPLSMGSSHENIAIVLRDMGKHKLMIRSMMDALRCLREAGDPYRVSVALKNLGEAEWGLGFKKKACDYFDEAESIGDKLPKITQRFGVYWNLAVANRRLGRKEAELRYLKKCLSDFPDEYGDRILELENRFDELTR